MCTCLCSECVPLLLSMVPCCCCCEVVYCTNSTYCPSSQSPFPIEEMGAISQPVEESQPPHQPLLDPSGGVGRDVPRVQEDGEGMTSSQEHMDVGESVPPSTSLPREETVSPQEPTASGGSTHHTSTHFRDRERERRLAFEREREDMWARRRDRFFSSFDVSLSSCMLTSCGAELSYQSQVQL